MESKSKLEGVVYFFGYRTYLFGQVFDILGTMTDENVVRYQP